jgi:hypothetical protein
MVETMNLEAQKELGNVPEEFVFWSCTGQVLRNLKDLKSELDTMSDEAYACHVNAEKNDFMNWVRDIIKDERLARDLQKAPGRLNAAKLVTRRIDSLSKRK